MRANIPPSMRRGPALELEGGYLQIMQEISSRLMDSLPAGDRLWETLAQAEALLMEAQMTGTPPDALFPKGGVAAFCQSIIDEYQAETDGRSEPPAVPAARDKSRTAERKQSPRGGINAGRYRHMTWLMTAAVLLTFAVILLFCSGFVGYLTKGSAYYHEELYNFENTHMEARGESLIFDLTPAEKTGLSTVLYADGEGYTISLSSVGYRERKAAETDGDGRPIGKKLKCWYIILRYTVDADFLQIRTVTPTPAGTATVTLADGTVYRSTLTSDSSGPLENGLEYVRITVAEIPADADLNGATITVTMDPPVYRVWKRMGIGKR